ncbi:MAG: acylphosphatase, partial [Pseudomonadota bacterium]
MAEQPADDARSFDSLRVRVRGRVQGVGFRPFVHALARELSLVGTVRNDAEGVLVEAWGARVAELPALLRERAPPLARVDAVEVQGPATGGAPRTFRIVETVGCGRAGTSRRYFCSEMLLGLPRLG